MMMTYTITARREDLKGLLNIADLADETFKVTISPMSEEEAQEIEFKSLKGIAGKYLDADEVRRERRGL